MKKLLAVGAALFVAVTASAASVSWSVTGITTPGSTSKASGYVAYLFDEATVSSSTIASAIAGGTFADQISKALSTGTSNMSGAITKSGIGSYGASATTDSPEVRKFYTVLFAAGPADAAEKYIISADSTVTFTSPTGSKAAAFVNIVSNAASGWQNTSAVPEPTSGLLLLLGLAGIALKRKVA